MSSRQVSARHSCGGLIVDGQIARVLPVQDQHTDHRRTGSYRESERRTRAGDDCFPSKPRPACLRRRSGQVGCTDELAGEACVVPGTSPTTNSTSTSRVMTGSVACSSTSLIPPCRTIAAPSTGSCRTLDRHTAAADSSHSGPVPPMRSPWDAWSKPSGELYTVGPPLMMASRRRTGGPPGECAAPSLNTSDERDHRLPGPRVILEGLASSPGRAVGTGGSDLRAGERPGW